MNPLHDPEWHRVDAAANIGLGAVLLSEYYHRLQCGIFGPNKPPGRWFSNAVWVEAGYSIDAPDCIPAGGMTSFVLEGDAMPEQIVAQREGEQE